MNVAVGILRAESGCLAREWVAWEREMVWDAGEAVDREVVQEYLEGGDGEGDGRREWVGSGKSWTRTSACFTWIVLKLWKETLTLGDLLLG